MENSFTLLVAVTMLAVIIFVLFFFNSGRESIPTGINHPTSQTSTIKLTSPAFQNNQNIPIKYTCQGQNINPPLTIENTPKGTQSLVLIMDDPDASAGTWDHWVIYNIPPETIQIQENASPGTPGKNSWNNTNYGGPCPQAGPNHYRFKLYALDSNMQFVTIPTKSEIESAIQSHILEQTTLTGLYSRN